jgi:beta-phosphoglucomutase
MIKAVLFDLDGVIVSTDEYHFQGWKKMADDEDIYFDRSINERCRGVSRMESLDIVLEKSSKKYSAAEKTALAERKNNYYKELLKNISPKDILPGALECLKELKKRGIKIAIGSSSKNAKNILKQIGLLDMFDAVSDGTDITRSKPDPEVFLIAAERCGVKPEESLVVEDAEAGVSAALAGRMFALGVGSAAEDKRAHLRAKELKDITVDKMLSL